MSFRESAKGPGRRSRVDHDPTSSLRAARPCRRRVRFDFYRVARRRERNMTPGQTDRYRAIADALAYLESATDKLVDGIGPAALDSSGKFRFAEKSARVVQLCKLVSCVSAMYGALRLLPTSQYAEILILLRTATDCMAEITYLHEPQQGGEMTADHQRFVDHFFEEHGDTMEELLKSPPRASLVERKKINASFARQITPDNPYKTQRDLAVIDAVMSGFVHGSQSSVMELYEGGTWRFRMRGMPDTPRSRQAERQIVLAVDRAFNAVRSVAFSCRNESIFESSKTERLSFEQSPACEGMTLTPKTPPPKIHG